MKKVITILLVLVFVASSCFAALIQIGPTVRFSGSDFTDTDQLKDFGNYHAGADTRFNFGLFEIAANALIGKNGNIWTFDTLATANLHLEAFVFDFNIGAGIELPISFGDGIDGVLLAGKAPEDFASSIGESMILLRAAGGVNIGSVGLAVDYILPWGAFKEIFTSDAVAALKSGRVSASILFNIL